MLWHSLKILIRAICKGYGVFFSFLFFLTFLSLLVFLQALNFCRLIVQIFLQWENNIFSSSNFFDPGKDLILQ